jgi:hypothetical protein
MFLIFFSLKYDCPASIFKKTNIAGTLVASSFVQLSSLKTGQKCMSLLLDLKCTKNHKANKIKKTLQTFVSGHHDRPCWQKPPHSELTQVTTLSGLVTCRMVPDQDAVTAQGNYSASKYCSDFIKEMLQVTGERVI